MPQWIWQQADWPKFTWDEAKISPSLAAARLIQGKLLGFAQSLEQYDQTRFSAQILADEMITSSAIEGEMLNRDSVRSSIAERLGLANAGISGQPDRYVEGLLDMMLDATDHYARPLTLARLSGWQAALFPTGYSGLQKINVGQLRGKGEMQIVSGRPGKITVHYIAPPREKLAAEIKQFLQWFNNKRVSTKLDGLIRAAIAHLWFEILHPFDDGNGRVGRAIIDMALAQDEQLAARYYSLSAQMMAQRKSYYAVLEQTTRGTLDITAWLEWFLHCFTKAIEQTFKVIDTIARKSRFWQHHAQTALNDHQRKVLNRMLDKGPNGFAGGMTTRKYMNLTKTSRATAYRELSDLVAKGCLTPLPTKGRSSAYQLVWPD